MHNTELCLLLWIFVQVCITKVGRGGGMNDGWVGKSVYGHKIIGTILNTKLSVFLFSIVTAMKKII